MSVRTVAAMARQISISIGSMLGSVRLPPDFVDVGIEFRRRRYR